MDDKNIGIILGIQGQVAEVQFNHVAPAIHDVLVMVDDPLVRMEVYSSSRPHTYFCLLLSPTTGVMRRAKVFNTQKSLMMPAGKELLGRVIDTFGNPLDGKGAISATDGMATTRSPSPVI